MDQCSLSIPKNFRSWEVIQKESKEKSLKFKVVSYNVLAQDLLECHPDNYAKCSPRNLHWDTRAYLLYEEIKTYAPDIICLQEVQASHIETFFSNFNDLGYQGIFKQKTGQKCDGCAIYFKKSLFSLQESSSVEFFQPNIPLLNRDNVGVMVKLLPKLAPKLPFVVATTHLLYNPKRTDVRLAQIRVFLAEIDRFSYFNTGTDAGHLPILLTGDLNSTPYSPVVQLLDRGLARIGSSRDGSDWSEIGVTDKCQHLSVYISRTKGELTSTIIRTKLRNMDNVNDSGDTNVEELDLERYSSLFNGDIIEHSFNLKSVYPKVKENGIYEATTYQDGWVTVDYIYYNNKLTLLKRLRLPTAHDCIVLGQLPNSVFGSDHLALAAVFELKIV